MNLKEAYTFDDVLLQPSHSRFGPGDANVSTFISKDIFRRLVSTYGVQYKTLLSLLIPAQLLSLNQVWVLKQIY